MTSLRLFAYLQLLDFLTTLVGFQVGLREASPFIRWLAHFGPVTGVAASKAVAFALAGICIWSHRQRVIGWMNHWYAALVIWNLAAILVYRMHSA